MRVLITSLALDAHFNGSVPLAWALRTAGHEVRVAAHPSLTESITRAGLTAVPVGIDPPLDRSWGQAGQAIYHHHRGVDLSQDLSHDFLAASITTLTSIFYSQMNNDSMIDDMVSFAKDWRPDLVLWEPFTFAGAVAARVSGAAHARLLSFPDLFGRMRHTFVEQLAGQPAHHRDDPLGDWLTWTLGRYGCEFDEEIVTGQWVVDQMPASVRVSLDQHVVPMRYVPYNGPSPAVVPDWLREPPQRPRICLTTGLTPRSLSPNEMGLEDFFEVVADLDVEIVATLDAEQRALLSHIPDNARLVDYVALHALMPTCSAIIHHGGAGTWSTAAIHGVPQLVLAWVWDDVYRAKRVQELGAGLFLPPDQLSPQTLRDRLVRLLRDRSFKDGAERLRQEMLAEPSPNDVVSDLEKLSAR